MPIGSLIGGSDDQNYYKETAICKSDCLLLMIQNNIFEQMKVFKLIRAKQNLFNHFIKAFPYALDTFSEADIKYNILKIWKYNKFKKGEIIQKEF